MSNINTSLPPAEQILSDSAVVYDGVEMSIAGIGARYALSELGLHHAGQDARFTSRYGYGSEAMIVDLGDDVHPVRHMAHTEAHVDYLVRFQNTAGYDVEPFSSQQAFETRVAAMLHDIGENTHPSVERHVGHVVGDVWVEAKHDGHDRDEQQVRAFIFHSLFGNLPLRLIDRVEEIVQRRDTGDISTHAFEMTEYLGYYKTGIKAGELALAIMHDQPDQMETLRFEQLTRLARRVTMNWRGILGEQASVFSALAFELRGSEPTFEAIHSQLQDTFPE